MKLEDIEKNCSQMLYRLGPEFDPEGILGEIGATWNDVHELVETLAAFDFSLRSRVDEAISRKMMDEVPMRSSPAMRLMYRLRLENALDTLNCLCRGYSGAIQVDPLTDEEALLWALTNLWRLTAPLCLHRLARRICGDIRTPYSGFDDDDALGIYPRL
ncbi:MAG: hypothetical protein ACI4UY_05995 [Kiritimatiellia bacterium]